MRVLIIGAGIVGVATAFELAAEGHEVTVLERRASVAEESSFGHAGLLAPGLMQPWLAPAPWPSWPGGAAPGFNPMWLRSRPAAPGQLRWLWQHRRSSRPAQRRQQQHRLELLARMSQQRLGELARAWPGPFERSRGCLMLLKQARDAAAVQDELAQLTEAGLPVQLIDAARARALEPGLNPEAELHAALHFPEAESGNGRQFAHLMRAEAQRLGARFRFHREVVDIAPGPQPQVRHRPAAGMGGGEESTAADAVVLCAAPAAAALLRTLGWRLPVLAVQGYSLSAPLRHLEGHLALGPRGAVIDARTGVSITRLGQRIRVAGLAELGGDPQALRAEPIQRLHQVLHDWFPGAAQIDQAQRWKGARPMLPDGGPAIGPAGLDGIWLNTGHGPHGWALACGSARWLAHRLTGCSLGAAAAQSQVQQELLALDPQRLLRRR